MFELHTKDQMKKLNYLFKHIPIILGVAFRTGLVTQYDAAPFLMGFLF